MLHKKSWWGIFLSWSIHAKRGGFNTIIPKQQYLKGFIHYMIFSTISITTSLLILYIWIYIIVICKYGLFNNLANKVILLFSWNILNAITKPVWCKCTSTNTLQCGFSIEFLLLLRCRHHIWVFIFSLSLLYVSLMSSMREKKRSLRFYCKS